MIDELRRKKFLKDLSGDTSVDTSVDAIPAVVTADQIEVEPESRPSTFIPRESNTTMADVATGAAPALIGLLGGNYNRAAMGFDTSNKYVQALKKEDEAAAKSLVKTRGDLGEPVYTQTRDAAGMEAYQPTKSARDSSAAKSFTNYDAYDSVTGERFPVLFNSRLGQYLNPDGTKANITKSTILKPVAEKLLKMKDIQGTETASLVDQYSRKPVRSIKTEPGIGKYYGVATEGQGKVIEKGLEEGQKEYQTLSGNLAEAKTSLATLRKSKDPRQISGAIYASARAVEPKGAFTDQDFTNITGQDYRSWYKNTMDTLSTKGAGEIAAFRDSFIPMAEAVQAKIEERMSTIPGRFAPGTKKGQEAIEAVAPVGGMSKLKKAEYIKMERSGAAKYGKGTPMYNKYIEFHKNKLGL